MTLDLRDEFSTGRALMGARNRGYRFAVYLNRDDRYVLKIRDEYGVEVYSKGGFDTLQQLLDVAKWQLETLITEDFRGKPAHD